MSRMEEYVEAIITGDNDDLPAPRSERERDYYEAAKRGMGGGGTGGGVTSWDDLQDRPFYETTVTLIDNQTFTLDPEQELFVLSESQLIEVGKTYDVVYNGVEYKGLVCFAVQGVPFIGNYGAIADVEDTGEPFAIAYEPGGGTALIPLDGSTEITLTLTFKTVKPLDIKYVPPKKECNFIINGTLGGNTDRFDEMTVTCNIDALTLVLMNAFDIPDDYNVRIIWEVDTGVEGMPKRHRGMVKSVVNNLDRIHVFFDMGLSDGVIAQGVITVTSDGAITIEEI